MKTSDHGRALIEQREGRRLTAYRDSRGIWTIGVGHAATGRPPKPYAGMTISETECNALLAADLAPVESVVDRVVAVPMSQNEFDAMVSLGFNIGAGGLARSSVIRRLNLGNVSGAADAFMMWCKPPELTGRREGERKQFLEPGEPIAAARAAALSAKAAAAHGKARATRIGSVVTTAAGAAATAAVAGAGHHHVAWFVGALFALGAVVDGVTSVLHCRTAQTLAANAAAHTAITAAPATPAAPAGAVKS